MVADFLFVTAFLLINDALILSHYVFELVAYCTVLTSPLLHATDGELL